MQEDIKLAWRNIWRNKRRTAITMASVFFAIYFALMMRSMQLGTYSHAITGVVENYTGYLQVHKNGYHDEKTIDMVMPLSDTVMTDIMDTGGVTAVIPRLETFALGASENLTKPVMVLGVDPDAEHRMTKIEEKITAGTMVREGDNGALLGVDLAKYLGLGIGDTLTMIGQGYHGASAAGLYVVQGLISFSMPAMDSRVVVLHLSEAQYFSSAFEMVSSLLINIDDPDDVEEIQTALSEKLGSEYEVRTWQEISPELVQQIESDQAGGYIILALLYMIVGFGVFGTVLMMTTERKREFGVMVAVGMQKTRLSVILAYEMMLMGLSGIIAGVIGSIPLIYLMHLHPLRFGGDTAEMMASYGYEAIMPFAWQADFFFGQAGVVFLIFLIAIVYPLYATSKIKVIKALRA
ncbi:MAG: ABC transporter permease [Marinilabiliales bacterium]|nr:MAG: ABC transporter permease [Marinilabiliales bacterium]